MKIDYLTGAVVIGAFCKINIVWRNYKVIVCVKHGLQQDSHQSNCKFMQSEKSENGHRLIEVLSQITSHKSKSGRS